MRIKNYGIALVLSLTITSCNSNDKGIENGVTGQGPIVTRTLSIENFTGVNLATSPNVTIKQGATQEVKATGQSNVIDVISTNVNNNIWKIGFTSGVNGNHDLSIEITIPYINYIEASSSGGITIEDFNNQTSLILKTSSSGEISLNEFEGITELNVNVGGSEGHINANKNIESLQTLTINVTRSANFNGFSITSDDCTVTNTSSGHSRVTANNTLDVTISSSGNIYYKGNPTITQNITSSGQLIDAN